LGERGKRSSKAETIKADGHPLPISIDDETNSHAWSDRLSLARGHSLTAYVAAYLELAIRRGLLLATIYGDPITVAEAVDISCG
jgi:predicted nucleic acid-binding protein